jgi:hypothetical protein
MAYYWLKNAGNGKHFNRKDLPAVPRRTYWDAEHSNETKSPLLVGQTSLDRTLWASAVRRSGTKCFSSAKH